MMEDFKRKVIFIVIAIEAKQSHKKSRDRHAPFGRAQ
jgi:hypothetical protein